MSLNGSSELKFRTELNHGGGGNAALSRCRCWSDWSCACGAVTVVRVRFRIIDRSFDRVHESRALAIQARTLEILDSLGVADVLVAHGNPFAGW